MVSTVLLRGTTSYTPPNSFSLVLGTGELGGERHKVMLTVPGHALSRRASGQTAPPGTCDMPLVCLPPPTFSYCPLREENPSRRNTQDLVSHLKQG